MDKEHVSLKSAFRIFPGFARKFRIGSQIALLLIAAIPVAAKAASTQSLNCFDVCDQSLSSCMQTANGNPTLEANCQDRYDLCVEQCMINP